MEEKNEIQFSLATENHKNNTTCADTTFHICIALHILTQGKEDNKRRVQIIYFLFNTPILTFIVKVEPKIFKETLLLFMKFMIAF